MKRIICAVLCVILAASAVFGISAAEWQNPFTDVKSGEWYYESIEYVSSRNLFAGMTETVFGTNLSMTRAMFVTVLGRLDKAPNNRDEKTQFTDVPSGSWFSGYVAWANTNGIVYGKSDTVFDPNAPITREDMCVIIRRYAVYSGITLTKSQETMNFSDADKISGYAQSSVIALQEAGIIYGIGDSFQPKGLSTRAQVAAVIKRISLLAESQAGERRIVNGTSGIMLESDELTGNITEYTLNAAKNADAELISQITEYGIVTTYDISVSKSSTDFALQNNAQMKIPYPSSSDKSVVSVYTVSGKTLTKISYTDSNGYMAFEGKPGRYAVCVSQWTPNY